MSNRDAAPFRLDGQVALVTGAGRGLGLEMARGLARAGATVIINGRDAGRLAAARDGLAQDGSDAQALAFDLTDDAAVTAALTDIMARFGRLDILVNNAAARDRRALAQFGPGDMEALLAANIAAPFEISRKAAALMKAAGYGRIINITSIAASISRAGDALYTTSKGGLDAMTRALAAELGPHGVTVNSVAPGYFATEANAGMVADAGVEAWLGQRTSLGRWGRPEEIAGAVVFLASREASYITGHALAVDGGFLAHF
ncbi:SDR family oxidoreductase [Camelimonas lactis]|uniref:Gluconate 5-dehydrogenase n=1 Tax=Camelimonas lactis TaxID=659006 RepID=A0A4R2GQ27_9HYPH|nr:SDR family oxidoreductase [Camelimonas lactis]TCO11431.1 gluconate 5-dehydrogenase [Camelimonas lactis]